jgi:hypothetical protein
MELILKLLRDPALAGFGALATCATLALAYRQSKRAARWSSEVQADSSLSPRDGAAKAPLSPRLHYYSLLLWSATIISVWAFCGKAWQAMPFSSDVKLRLVLFFGTSLPALFSILSSAGAGALADRASLVKQQADALERTGLFFAKAGLAFLLLLALVFFPGGLLIDRFLLR